MRSLLNWVLHWLSSGAAVVVAPYTVSADVEVRLTASGDVAMRVTASADVEL